MKIDIVHVPTGEVGVSVDVMATDDIAERIGEIVAGALFAVFGDEPDLEVLHPAAVAEAVRRVSAQPADTASEDRSSAAAAAGEHDTIYWLADGTGVNVASVAALRWWNEVAARKPRGLRNFVWVGLCGTLR